MGTADADVEDPAVVDGAAMPLTPEEGALRRTTDATNSLPRLTHTGYYNLACVLHLHAAPPTPAPRPIFACPHRRGQNVMDHMMPLGLFRSVLATTGVFDSSASYSRLR